MRVFMKIDAKNRIKNAERRRKKNGLSMFGYTAVLGAALISGAVLYSRDKAIDERDNYFFRLPREVVAASDDTFLGMRNRVTKGLSEKLKPSIQEFGYHAAKYNPRFVPDDFHKNFGLQSKIKELILPNYDGKGNNVRK
jgi:hypothetical protein